MNMSRKAPGRARLCYPQAQLHFSLCQPKLKLLQPVVAQSRVLLLLRRAPDVAGHLFVDDVYDSILLQYFQQNYSPHMRWYKRGVGDILATRNEFRSKVVPADRSRRNKMEAEEGQQSKMESILKKGEFSLEDRVEMVRYIEKKFRIYFSELLTIAAFEVVALKERKMIEREYEPLKRSYYLFSGRAVMTTWEGVLLTEGDENEEEDRKGQQRRLDNNRMVVQSQRGIGWVFDNDKYSNCSIQAQGIILKITHSTATSLSLIQKHCLLTNRERQLFLKKFKLFSSVQNLNKFYLPFFQVRKYTKGECVYCIGDQPEELYLIVDGNVAFESMVAMECPEEGQNRRLKRSRNEEVLFVTETINKDNFFGEEEILSQSKRRQNARCASIECVVMAVSQDKLSKLLAVPEFRRSLELSSVLKLDAREHQISNFLVLAKSKRLEPEGFSAQDLQRFGQLKSAIFTQLFQPKEETAIKSRYSKEKKRILHNHSLSVPDEQRAKSRPTDFSMLNVNSVMYEKTLMRFRYNLKELQKLGQPKQKAFPSRGRSLEEIWRTLKLERSFNPEEERIVIDEDDGLTYYNTHKRLARQLRASRCLRPKSLSCSNKMRTEYIEYLQMAL